MLSSSKIADLLQPYLAATASGADESTDAAEWGVVYDQLGAYLELLLKWNARMNLTAIREPEEIVRRHFGESLFAGRFVGSGKTLLDFGSGAGFPGIPIQLMRLDMTVTLAESQGKKAAFLREAVRELGLPSEVWGGRVETMPSERRFDVVAMRAVDKMRAGVGEAVMRAGGRVLILGTSATARYEELQDFDGLDKLELPGTRDGFLYIAERNVPRGTLS